MEPKPTHTRFAPCKQPDLAALDSFTAMHLSMQLPDTLFLFYREQSDASKRILTAAEIIRVPLYEDVDPFPPSAPVRPDPNVVASFDPITYALEIQDWFDRMDQYREKEPKSQLDYTFAIKVDVKVEDLADDDMFKITMTSGGLRHTQLIARRMTETAWESHHVARMLVDRAVRELEKVIGGFVYLVNHRPFISRTLYNTSVVRTLSLGPVNL